VSKYTSAHAVLDLMAAGHEVYGESRIQEALRKIDDVAEHTATPPQWHMIGHLQTNKVPQAIGSFAMIQSVDSRRLADAISRRATFLDLEIPVLLEVNIAADRTKHGFLRAEVMRDYAGIAQLPGLDVRGLMTIATQVPTATAARPYFAGLRDLRSELDSMGVAGPLSHLSMGMSADYEVAIEEGATIVRVGGAIFGGHEHTHEAV
jgi:pyridoxal phosphate enzyme (YggS family)